MKTVPYVSTVLLLSGLLALPSAASGADPASDLTDLSNTPISGASSVEIKPNVLFILDDSYSMSWNYLPDWAGMIKYRAGQDYTGSPVRNWIPDDYQSYNAGFNGIAYNPAVTYVPPSYFTADGAPDTSTYPDLNTPAQWKAVPVDGYGIQSTAKTDLTTSQEAFYFRTEPGEFCKTRTLKECRDVKSAEYSVPAYLRWCQTFEDSVMPNPTDSSAPEPACQAVYIDHTGASGGGSSTYMYPRMPSPLASTLTVGGTGYTGLDNLEVNGQKIMDHAVTASIPRDLAAAIVSSINACALSLPAGTKCAVAGYRASVSSTDDKIVVIQAPSSTGAQPSPFNLYGGGMTVTATPFGR